MEASILSPLRYPGSKRRLAGYLSEVLRLNRVRPSLFVEPFAGGASVALQLLDNDLVDRIALGERDTYVASFWRVVFDDSEWLIDAIKRVPATVDTWRKFREEGGTTDRDRALACLFLNRTSFSGILNRRAGPIGGLAQKSSYSIGCRMALPTIEKRIRQAARLKDRVAFVHSGPWSETIEAATAVRPQQNGLFFYFDPPFWQKADRLYRHWFTREDHQTLHDSLVTLEHPWLLSYDPAPEAIAMYTNGGHGVRHIDILYSASATGGPASTQEIIITNLDTLPEATRLWRSSSEWRQTPNGREALNTHEGLAAAI
jgi:DNA adenine methylase